MARSREEIEGKYLSKKVTKPDGSVWRVSSIFKSDNPKEEYFFVMVCIGDCPNPYKQPYDDCPCGWCNETIGLNEFEKQIKKGDNHE